MANPPTTARQTPHGHKMPDGFKTQIAFALNPNLAIFEVKIKLPAIDGGAMIDTTTQLNNVVRTKHPRALIDIGEITGSGNFNSLLYTQFQSIVNKVGGVTLHLPDLSTIDVWASLIKLEPGEQAEGTFPECSFTVGITNEDPNTGAETLPVRTPPPGTGS